jgi:large conductance mechanosensitive channel
MVKKVKAIDGFMDFIREQGVVGLAVGFVLGGASKDVVTSLIDNIVDPILGLFLGSTRGLEAAKFSLVGAEIMYGAFLSTLLDFIVVAAVVYYIVKGFGFEKLDKKKE